MCTLQDALQVIKKAALTPETSAMPKSLQFEALTMMDKAHKSLAFLSRSSSVSRQSSATFDGTSLTKPLSISEGNGYDAPLPIRLEDWAFELPEEYDPQLECGVILFNIGLSYVYASRARDAPKEASNIRQRAINILQMAQMILEKASLTMTSKVEEEENLVWDDRIDIEKMVARVLSEVHAETGNFEDAALWHRRAEMLSTEGNQMSAAFLGSIFCASPAA